MSKIIFLNGCGSAGKTSIAKTILEYVKNNPAPKIFKDIIK